MNEEERNEENKLEMKREFDREKLLTKKVRIEMQIKFLNFYQMICNTKDAEQYYTDNVIRSVRNARDCIPDVEMIIENASELVEKCEAQFGNDYKQVPDEICDFTMAACNQALKALKTGRNSISSGAVEALKKLSHAHGLTKNDREEFLKVLYDLEDAEYELQKLCEQMKINVKYRTSFDELKELIKDINKATKKLRKQIRVIPTEDNAAKVIKIIEYLEDEIKEITRILDDPTKTQSVAASSAQLDLEQ